MLLIPIMDIKNGKCVHTSGHGEQKCIVESSAVEVARQWIEAGIKRIHMIDIDAMFSNMPENVNTVRAVKDNFPETIIQIGGGIYQEDDIFIWLDAGVDYIAISENRIKQPDLLEVYSIEFPGKIMLSIDLKQGKQSNPYLINRYGENLAELVLNLQNDGLSGLIISNSCNKLSTDKESASSLNYLNGLPEGIEMPIFINGMKNIFQEPQRHASINNNIVKGMLVGREIFDNNMILKKVIKTKI